MATVAVIVNAVALYDCQDYVFGLW